MRRIVDLLMLVLCLGVLPASAQSILPDSLPGWSASPISPFAPAQANSGQNAAVASAAAAEYGFVKGEQRTYSTGADSLQIAVLQMKDPSGAYTGSIPFCAPRTWLTRTLPIIPRCPSNAR